MSEEVYYLTPQGLKEHEEKLSYLRNVRRQEVAERLRIHGVRVSVPGSHRLRLVTNRHVTPDDLPLVVDAFRSVLAT